MKFLDLKKMAFYRGRVHLTLSVFGWGFFIVIFNLCLVLFYDSISSKCILATKFKPIQNE